MREELLHFVWKLQLFNTQKLNSTKNKLLEIISKGLYNFNSGPDFLNAKIRIGEELWVGNVEIHLKSSDWYAHQHQQDENYNTVILHVVWEDDMEVFRNSNEAIPTLELKEFVSKKVLGSYQSLFNSPKKWINCEREIHTVSKFKLNHFFEQLYFERLEQKSSLVFKELQKSNNNWEAVLFKLLLKNFGLKVNGESFNNLANSVDFSIVRKVSASSLHLEALLFGQAGLLIDFNESRYYKELKKEYLFLQSKFKLESLNGNQIQFFRLRPNNFPTIRLSQMSQLYSENKNFFSKVIEARSIEEVYSLFDVKTSEFWDTHYTFSKESKKRVKKLSKSFIDLVLINTIIPVKFLYLNQLGKPTDEILELIQKLKPEKNVIISKFNDLKIESNSGFETQALLQLKNEYCNKLNCLNCTIGKELLTS